MLRGVVMLYRWFDSLLKRLVGVIRRYFWGVPRISGPVKCVHLIRESKMGLVYKVFMPEVVDADLVKRILKVSVDGVDSFVDVPVNVDSVDLSPVADNAAVSLTVAGVDDAGNQGDWSDPYDFVAVDTIFPVKPGLVSVKLIAEVADPVVEPPVDEVPVEEPPVEEVPVEEPPVDEVPPVE